MSGASCPERHRLAADYEIPRIVVGLWQLSEGHRDEARVDPGAAVDELTRFVDAGFDTFDCADIYTGVEELLGRLVRARPGLVRVHTKFVPDRGALAQVDRAYVERVIDRSLCRLGVERLDLVQFHWWDFAVPGWVETAGWLEQLRVAGKIRHLGLTNFDAGHLAALREAGVAPVSDQVQYSLLDRRPERSLVAELGAGGGCLLAYGTLAGGFLSDRWLGRDRPGPPYANRSLHKYALVIEDGGGWEALQGVLQAARDVADRHGVALASVATRWVLDRPGVAAAIVGARDASRLAHFHETLGMRLEEADRCTIQTALARLPGPAGEVYELERDPRGRHAAIMRTDLSRA